MHLLLTPNDCTLYPFLFIVKVNFLLPVRHNLISLPCGSDFCFSDPPSFSSLCSVKTGVWNVITCNRCDSVNLSTCVPMLRLVFRAKSINRAVFSGSALHAVLGVYGLLFGFSIVVFLTCDAYICSALFAGKIQDGWEAQQLIAKFMPGEAEKLCMHRRCRCLLSSFIYSLLFISQKVHTTVAPWFQASI